MPVTGKLLTGTVTVTVPTLEFTNCRTEGLTVTVGTFAVTATLRVLVFEPTIGIVRSAAPVAVKVIVQLLPGGIILQFEYCAETGEPRGICAATARALPIEGG